MANARPTHRFSPFVVAGLILGAPALIVFSVLVPNFVYGTPATPAHTIAQVTAKLDQMARANETLSESYNAASADVVAKQKAAVAAQYAATDANAAYAVTRARLSQTITAEYEGSSFSHAGALLLSTTGANYLDALSALGVVDAHRADLVTQADASRAVAANANATAASLLRAAKAKQIALATQKAAITKSIAAYKVELATLTLAQQKVYTGRNTVPVAIEKAYTVHAGNKAAQIAVNFALAQLGKPYVFAAAGPGAYDCSGLTMASWAAAGVALPHLAAAQYNYGTHVSVSALQPGDLLFYYHPIGHVTIYVGNGLMASAPQPGENVKLVTVASYMGDFVGATRLK